MISVIAQAASYYYCSVAVAVAVAATAAHLSHD